MAIDLELRIPLVYNYSGYESTDTLRILKGVIDIYMPDFKFWDPETSKKWCKAHNYPGIARNAIKEMHDPVGNLKTNKAKIAYAGLIIRHLVMPGNLDETYHILKFLKEEISSDIYVNIMSQHHQWGMPANSKIFQVP